MTRREALALLAAAPLGPLALRGARQGQAALTTGRRVFTQRGASYVIEADGSVKVWGLGEFTKGFVGLGSTGRIPASVAFDLPDLRGAVMVAGGVNSTYALMADGSVLAWGSNARGQIGNTPESELEVSARARDNANTPTQVLGVGDAVALAAGEDHAVVATRRGSVLTWGYNLAGQLGVNPRPVIHFKTHAPSAMDYVPFPITVAGLADVIGVAAGVDYSLALLKDGTIRAWGGNKQGQLGDGTTIDRPTPVAVTGVRGAVAVAAGGQNSAAVLGDGTVMTWGAGNGSLGRRVLKRDVPYPIPALVDGVAGVTSIVVTGGQMQALSNSGAVISWGDSILGEVGHAGDLPARIPRLTSVRSIAAAGATALFVQTDNTIMTCGGVPVYARFYGENYASPFPIPLVIKNLRNPW